MGRPTTPLLQRDVVVKAALDIIDAEGLDALTMRALADRFDVNVASFYNHFEGKDDLLRAVCALIYREIEFPDERTEHWTDLTVRTATYFRQVMLRHPNAVPVMTTFHPRQVIPGIYERVGQLLVERGVPEDLVDVIANAFDALVFGSVNLALAGQREASESDGAGPRLEEWAQANRRSEDEEWALVSRSLGDGLAAFIAASARTPAAVSRSTRRRR